MCECLPYAPEVPQKPKQPQSAPTLTVSGPASISSRSPSFPKKKKLHPTAGQQGDWLLLTCDPEHGSLRGVQHGPSVDFPLISLMSWQVPGQSIPGSRWCRAGFVAVIIVVWEIRRGGHGAVQGRVPRTGALRQKGGRKGGWRKEKWGRSILLQAE